MIREGTIKWLESLKKEVGKAENQTLLHYAEAIDMAIEVLSSDAVEVVRCKDCKHYQNEHICQYFSRFGTIETPSYGYCCFGERREP